MILLAGGGDPDQAQPIDEYFAGHIDIRGRVIYIPVAMEERVFSYAECERWFRETYAPYGIRNVEMWTRLRGCSLEGDVAAVFLGGGNTFKLMAQLRKERFDEELVRYARRGGVIYGGSAGAIAMGRSIETALHADRNDAGLDDLRGLDLLGGKDVWCHYSDADSERLSAYPRAAYALYEESGLAVEGESVKALGRAYIFHHASKGERFSSKP